MVRATTTATASDSGEEVVHKIERERERERERTFLPNPSPLFSSSSVSRGHTRYDCTTGEWLKESSVLDQPLGRPMGPLTNESNVLRREFASGARVYLNATGPGGAAGAPRGAAGPRTASARRPRSGPSTPARQIVPAGTSTACQGCTAAHEACEEVRSRWKVVI